jgi:hypothetical protein
MDHQFRLKWTVLTSVGWATGLLMSLALGAPIQVVVGMMLVTPTVTGLAGGVLGLSQWWTLRARHKAGWWAPATAFGVSIGLTLGITLVEQVSRWWTGGPVNVARLTAWQRAGSFAAIGLVTGLCLGAAQWLVLRRLTVASRSWPVTTAIAMTAALTASSLLTDSVVGNIAAPLGFGVFAILSGCAFGALSSLRLRTLLWAEA